MTSDFARFNTAPHFDNRWLRALPADPVMDNVPRQVVGASYSWVTPRRASNPTLVAYAHEVAERLGLSREDCESEAFAQVFSGNQLLEGMEPHASAYGGHQFGHWAGQLGDGRAINLGELLNTEGEHWTLQLKGAGRTPYSRGADGLAVLRSSVREFLCSEAMHHLGVPTTRALSLVLTGDSVERDMFYDGNPQQEPGAVVCRVAPSFVRFGNFQLHAAREEHALLKRLLDFTIEADFPHLGEPGPETYVRWLEEVATRTAQMVAHWMRVGFVHGVMNTDNLSVLGLTIDYGPYGWLEGYDPTWTPNTTDAQGRRYRFGAQPQVALWNLAQLANAIYPLVEQVEPLQAVMDLYRKEYQRCWERDMANKLGLAHWEGDADGQLVNDLQRALVEAETDMTIFFRNLADFDPLTDQEEDPRGNETLLSVITNAYYQAPSSDAEQLMADWLRRYRDRLVRDTVVHGAEPGERRARMNRTNPKYVLRNYMAQQAIDMAEQGDFSEIHRLQALLRRPYDEQPENQHYFARRPEWARDKAGCSMLSCSS
ncbi:protein adenylyltransferase SelO [Marinimicrobium agarilyticum]|uniref:protein adenylyltransferase SelO n=1 Tax=Marinimicrobium agarilyticum TaxID=306546 RepID=UPI0003FD4F03|nr:YdiU family protein [Marinimicrobium agarilyticum]